MDRYQQTIDWLFVQLPMFQVLGPGAYKPGLKTSRTLAEAFGNPQRQFKTIHVAGTNGKGSVSHSLASILMAAGYKVGLYTSPHLVDFRERIRIDGRMMPKQAVIDFVDRYRDMRLGLEPSFFELTTIMAFDYFSKSEVDYAVIEVGLGGRLDTTNIIAPELCVITNISLDHMSLLGNTEAEIAGEKAGIIKPGIPVVIGMAHGDVKEVFERVASEQRAPICWAQDRPVEVLANSESHVKYKDPEWGIIESDLTGECQPENARTVLQCADLLPVSQEAVRVGMSDVQGRTGIAGRWMTVQDCPRVICDTGHNIGAWVWLAPQLESISESQGLHVVIGFANDKDRESIFKLLPRKAEYYYVAPDVKRSTPSSELKALGDSHGLSGEAYGSVAEGYRAALAKVAPDEVIFVGGSNFVVAELLPLTDYRTDR